MSAELSRRRFVTGSLTAGAAAGFGNYSFLAQLPAVAAAETTPARGVQFSPEIEPLVRLIEDTPRERTIEAVAARRVSPDFSYQQLLSALLLAGVRNLKPRPVGFEFHAVLVIHSAHLAALAAADRDRWLPLFWAIDNFKASQAVKKAKGAWVMPTLNESELPPPHQARQRFVDAMDNWDVEGADRAIAALYRSAGASEIIELFWRYGARDFRDIGHKAIYVANSWRTLQTIGWRHAEPVLRSLAFALLEHEGENPAKRDAEPDRPWRENLKRAAAIGALDARPRHLSNEAVVDLLATIRNGSPAESCDKVVDVLRGGVAAQSVWDAIFLGAGELLMRQPGIVGLHCVTSVNALHFAFTTSGNDETRRMVMLQSAAFLPMFRQAMLRRGDLTQLRIDQLETAELSKGNAEAIAEIFADVSRDRLLAARKTLGLVRRRPDDAPALMAQARRLIFEKGTNSHDYKFSSAALEDYFQVSPHWQAPYFATSMFNLRGTGDSSTDLVERIRNALKG